MPLPWQTKQSYTKTPTTKRGRHELGSSTPSPTTPSNYGTTTTNEKPIVVMEKLLKLESMAVSIEVLSEKS
jgi:hypothetical protein